MQDQPELPHQNIMVRAQLTWGMVLQKKILVDRVLPYLTGISFSSFNFKFFSLEIYVGIVKCVLYVFFLNYFFLA